MAECVWVRWPAEWNSSCVGLLCLFWHTAMCSACQRGEVHISHVQGVKGLWWFSLPTSCLRRCASVGPLQWSFLQPWRFVWLSQWNWLRWTGSPLGAPPKVHCHIHCFDLVQLQAVVNTGPAAWRFVTVLDQAVDPEEFDRGVTRGSEIRGRIHKTCKG